MEMRGISQKDMTFLSMMATHPREEILSFLHTDQLAVRQTITLIIECHLFRVYLHQAGQQIKFQMGDVARVPMDAYRTTRLEETHIQVARVNADM